MVKNLLSDGAQSILEACQKEFNMNITAEQGNGGLQIFLKEGKATIVYERLVEFFRGIGFLKQWVKAGLTDMERKEDPVFEHLTYMVDCSRNAVCNIPYLKDMIQKLAQMGYDRLMLYTEDTYEVEGQAFFGHLRGRYSREELKEIDNFALSYGIELVPCIQTLAHLNGLFHWKQYNEVKDTGDILCCGNEKTYQLIEDMVRTFADSCQSRVINIGMDEAEMIGRGSYIAQFGYKERFDIMEAHLKRVLDICHKYGYTCMMWSDMFFKMLTGGNYYDTALTFSEEVKARIPQGVELIYWDYYSRDPEKYNSMMVNHRQISEHVSFAGGAWKWNGFAPLLNHSMEISRMALEQCRKNRITNVIVTGWGDDGGEASQAVVLPVLSLYAEFCFAQNMDDNWIKERLNACTGACLSDFLKLDILNLTPDNNSPGKVGVGPAKYLLYQDVLMGMYDRHVDGGTYPGHYVKCNIELGEIAENGGEYGYLFEMLSSLAKVLSIKCDLGIRLKEAYDAKDRKELSKIEKQCTELISALTDFQKKQHSQWIKENKIFGLEVQDIRLGGLKERINTAAERIHDYLEGRIEKIEELEVDRLLLDERENPGHNTLPLGDCEWKKMVTAGVI